MLIDIWGNYVCFFELYREGGIYVDANMLLNKSWISNFEIVKYKFLFLIFWMIKKTKNVFSNNTII